MPKQELRERIWDELERQGVARFPFPPHGRIPNFSGATDAARRLSETNSWKRASLIKSNPDSPQRPVRRRALESGKIVYMAVPRLRDENCFIQLVPEEIDDFEKASTIGGSTEFGRQIHPDEMQPVDLIVTGSVAVNLAGARVGKGEGYSDLEFAILRTFELVDDQTITATTVHEIQVVNEPITTTRTDVPMDRIFTPKRSIHTEYEGSKPIGIEWEFVDEDRERDIPILAEIRTRSE